MAQCSIILVKIYICNFIEFTHRLSVAQNVLLSKVKMKPSQRLMSRMEMILHLKIECTATDTTYLIFG